MNQLQRIERGFTFKRIKCIQKLANRPVADGVQGQLAAMPDTV
jgi:hypothetical protein